MVYVVGEEEGWVCVACEDVNLLSSVCYD
jgi:hypothetical protein